MLRGLEGRRIGVVGGEAGESQDSPIIAALERAGAQIDRLDSQDADERFHGARYAALVVVNETSGGDNPRATQLVRDFLASDKPIAVVGAGESVLLRAGGAAGRVIAVDGSLRGELEAAGAQIANTPIHVDEQLLTASASADAHEVAQRIVAEFSTMLDEHAVDAMSDMSFPASDPPAISPSTIGRAGPDKTT